MKSISVVIVTSETQEKKGSCLLHSLQSVYNQDFHWHMLEVIIVDNGVNSSESMLKDFHDKFNPRRVYKYLKIDNGTTLSDSYNIGVKEASCDIIVNLDEDTVIVDRFTFKKIVANYINGKVWGLGAYRHWTRSLEWFKINSVNILLQLVNYKYSIILNSGLTRAPKDIYPELENRFMLLHFSSLKNFGYTDRQMLLKLGGLRSLRVMGGEDDYLAYQFYKETKGKVFVMDEYDVIHITHPTKNNNQQGIEDVRALINKDGYEWFYVERLIDRYNTEDDIMPSLKTKQNPIYD